MVDGKPPYVCLDCLERAWRNDAPCEKCGGRLLTHFRSLERRFGAGWCEVLEREMVEEGRPES